MAQDRVLSAMTNRSLRTVRAELDFLADTSVISPTQLSTIISQLPPDSATASSFQPHAHQPTPQPTPMPAMHNLSLDEKQNDNNNNNNDGFYAPSPHPHPAPPPASYDNSPAPLTYATALYAYSPSDAGDLALAPQDRIAVLEFMNADWWKGRSERTGHNGIFPRAYVREDGLPQQTNAFPPPVGGEKMGAPVGYGHVPVAVAVAQQDPQRIPSKGEDQAKKFGKKLGNAAIFGAGATIGSNIVNSIF